MKRSDFDIPVDLCRFLFKREFFFFLVFINIFIPYSFAGDITSRNGNEPWTIQADSLTFYHNTEVAVGEGAVKVQKGELTITADRIIYDQHRAKVKAYGSVFIQMGNDLLRADEGELDLKTQTGTMKDAQLYLHRNNIHLLAKTITKTGPEEYTAEDASISTCPLPKQAWNFKCKKLALTLTGNAVSWHNTFNIRDIPVLYSPWLSVPINRARKTGLLLPYFTSSSRNGLEINVPFYWAISDSMDMTLYQHPMTKRGWMEGVETRYVLSPETRGSIRFNYLIDTLEDNDFNHDGYVREGEKRWWLRAKANQELPFGFDAKIDIDLVSDMDYLDEFDEGPMGFRASNDQFLKEFNRSLVEKTDPIRPSTVQLTRFFNDSFIGVEGRFNDNRIPGEQDRTVQSLPEIIYQGYVQPMKSFPFYYSWDSSYIHYWREEGVKYQRIHAMPKAFFPVNLYGLGSLLLSASADGAAYSVTGEDKLLEPNDTPHRLTYSLESELSTSLARSYSLSSGKKTLQHSIRPSIRYQYRPSVDQSDLPYVDILDRLEPRNRITWSILSFLSSKSSLGEERFAYTDLLRFRIEQTYDSKKTARSIEESPAFHSFFDFYEELERELRYKVKKGEEIPEEDLDKYYFSPIMAEIDFRPNPYISLRYDTTYSVHGLGFTTYNLYANLLSPRGDHLYLTYRYNRLTSIDELNLDLYLKFNRKWSGIYETIWAFEESSEIKSSYGLRYQSDCWALTGRYVKEEEDSRVTFHVELLGIGGWNID